MSCLQANQQPGVASKSDSDVNGFSPTAHPFAPHVPPPFNHHFTSAAMLSTSPHVNSCAQTYNKTCLPHIPSQQPSMPSPAPSTLNENRNQDINTNIGPYTTPTTRSSSQNVITYSKAQRRSSYRLILAAKIQPINSGHRRIKLYSQKTTS
ncbi:hypothetical protein N7537_002422 [Penicillium hordei]|uniref:Uncharacterized protein n=1 Tax=Penicillium hordei TaxID=40994 RepID=A0AAD6H7S5_9EURO|nr:uncharacterized protein N7537_002422 [Penicillium hordei]KAJ5617308.1 hypothetical protein N7537_002422 [Penicillium hordei]